MRFPGLRLSTLVVLAILHHHIDGPGADYVGVFLAAAVSWVAVPGPGEAALVAAGISAAHGRLDISTVLAVAWAGATLGGTVGWIIGLKGGRVLLTAPGPLHGLRLSLTARGDDFFERYGPLAVLLVPSWVAGIHDMRPSRFLLANTGSAVIWVLAVGLGAYLLGPSITDVVGDVGLVGGILLGALIFGTVALVLWRRSHRVA